MSKIEQPEIIDELIPNHAGRGRPNGLKPILLVMHIQDGLSNPRSYFISLGDSGPKAADCTIWNPRADDGVLHRYLSDDDTAWTNGGWAEPINHDNPVIQNLFQQDIYTGDVSLTIEHEGHPADGITDAQLERSARIIAFWCQKFNIPADRYHIIGHYEIGPHKYCPGDKFPFTRLVARVQALLDAVPLKPDSGGGNAHPGYPDGYFPETGKYVVNVGTLPGGVEYNVGFLDYWQNNGGLAEFGFPISGMKIGTAEDGSTMFYQDFERARLEFHTDDLKIYRGRVGAESDAAGYPKQP